MLWEMCALVFGASNHLQFFVGQEDSYEEFCEQGIAC